MPEKVSNVLSTRVRWPRKPVDGVDVLGLLGIKALEVALQFIPRRRKLQPALAPVKGVDHQHDVPPLREFIGDRESIVVPLTEFRQGRVLLRRGGEFLLSVIKEAPMIVKGEHRRVRRPAGGRDEQVSRHPGVRRRPERDVVPHVRGALLGLYDLEAQFTRGRIVAEGLADAIARRFFPRLEPHLFAAEIGTGAAFGGARLLRQTGRACQGSTPGWSELLSLSGIRPIRSRRSPSSLPRASFGSGWFKALNFKNSLANSWLPVSAKPSNRAHRY